MRLSRFVGIGCLLAICVNANASALRYDSIWQCDRSKPNWYCDTPPQPPAPVSKSSEPKPRPKPAQSAQNTPPTALTLDQIRTTEQLRVELKRREDLAVMHPTEDNLKSYLELSTYMQDKASEFSDAWRRVVWQNPQFDYSLRNPHNNAAIPIQRQALDDRKQQALQDLSKEHGLIFFFRSDCRFCHAMAPTLQRLTATTGIEVLAVSIDGGGLKEYPNFTDGRHVAAQWGVTAVPALFIASKITHEHAPVGFGMVSLEELTNRIFVLTNTSIGEMY